MSHQSTGTEALVAAFSFNKNLHQAKLDWRFNQQFTDPHWATAYVGAELLAQQERASKRYDQQGTALRGSIDEQTRQNADHARVLQTTIRESSDAVRREMTNVKDAVDRTTTAVNGIATQVAHLAWLQAEQNTTLRHVLETIREGRANECRQLVEQGERNFHAGFLPDAEERFRTALGFDNTDYPTHQNLGLTLVGLGRLDEALTHFKKALAFPPKTADKQATGFFIARAATHAARVLYAQGDYAGAEMYLRKALDADHENAKNWYDLAVMRAYQGNSGGAIAALEHALSGNVLFAGAALADEELTAIRPEIEDLVIAQTSRALIATVEKPADELRQLNQRVAKMAQNVGVAIKPVDVDRIVNRARSSATLPATKEAFEQLQIERSNLVVRARAALQNAHKSIEHETHTRLRELDAERTAFHDDHTKRVAASDIAAGKSGPSAATQVLLTVVGFIVGAVIAGTKGGCGGMLVAGTIGGLLPMFLYTAVSISGRASARADRTRIRNEYGDFDAELREKEAAAKTTGEKRLKTIAAYDEELYQLLLHP
jgi:tetratricopeptide (TPR) repeat protein